MYTNWRCKELRPYKERIWEDVKSNCNVSVSYKKNCLKSVAKKWRNWRVTLKRNHYSIFDNDDERLANIPDSVDPYQWKIFVAYQGTAVAKERSRINRENQKKKVMSHTTGRKSHSVVRDEMTKDGKEPDRFDVYFKTHTRIDGSPVDQEAAEAMVAMKAMLQGVPEGQQTVEFREKVFTDVLGCDRHGRVRTVGLGPTPTEVFGMKNNLLDEQNVDDMENMRKEIREELREELREVVREETRDEVREVVRELVGDELRKEFNQKFKHLESQYAKLQVQVCVGQNDMPKSPIRKSVHVQEVSDAQSSHHLSEDPIDPPFEVGMVVHLLNLELPKKVVAEGIIISKDPTKEIDGIRLGDGFWIVRINKALLPHQPLLISCRNMRKVGQAIMKNVFWRTTDIKRK